MNAVKICFTIHIFTLLKMSVLFSLELDGILYQQLTAEYMEDATALLESAFYLFENVCRTLGVATDSEALKELKELAQGAVEDGVTVIAIDAKTNRVVGAAFNKLQTRNNTDFENLAKLWKNDKSKAVVAFMAYIDNLGNLFDYCKTDCILELMFLATSPKYGGRGNGKKLTEMTMEIGSQLANGVNVKQSVNGTEPKLEPVPGIVCAICTSFITQKIGEQLGFQVALEKQYDEIDFLNLNFSRVIESGTRSLRLVYKRL